MKITFEGHRGFLHKETGQVEFYSIMFHNIIQAREYLQYVAPGRYRGVYDEQKGLGLLDLDSKIKFYGFL